jgi:hypothetical protein
VSKRRLLEWGGLAAGVVLIGFGIASLVLSIAGHNEVRTQLAREEIVGTPDMTPEGIAQGAQEAGLPASIELPTCSVAGESVDTGSEAKCFADYMRIHALESTGGLTYAQMGQYVSAADPSDPAGTNDPAAAQKDADGNPVSNSARNIWVTETALATALYTSFLAEGTSLFGIVVGIALILAGLGFVILALGGALRQKSPKEDGGVSAVPG